MNLDVFRQCLFETLHIGRQGVHARRNLGKKILAGGVGERVELPLALQVYGIDRSALHHGA